MVQRMDLGECMKVHDLALRADYEIASKQQEYFFELDVSFSPLKVFHPRFTPVSHTVVFCHRISVSFSFIRVTCLAHHVTFT